MFDVETLKAEDLFSQAGRASSTEQHWSQRENLTTQMLRCTGFVYLQVKPQQKTPERVNLNEEP